MPLLRSHVIVFVFLAFQSEFKALADTIVLHGGRTVSGKIVAETSRSVTVESPNGRFTFAREKILSATKESPVQNQIREFEALLSKGNIDSAMAVFQDNKLSSLLTSDNLTRILINRLEPVATGAISTSPTAALLANQLIAKNTSSPEILLFAAALAVDSEVPETAVSLLQQIELTVNKPLIWSATTVHSLLSRIADGAIRRKYGTVVALLTSVQNRLPLPSDLLQNDSLTVYGQIDELTRKKQFLQATSMFRPDLFLRRADLFTPLAERLLIAILAAPPTNSSLAALESAKVSVMPYVDKTVRLRCMKILINRLIETKRSIDAQAIVDQTATQDSDLGATLQHLVDFQQRRLTLTNDQPMEMYKLAARGKSMGLLSESRSIFAALQSDPRFSETASLQLAVIDNLLVQAQFRQLQRLYDSDDLDQLKTEAAAFLNASPPDEFAQQTRNLLQLADFQNWNADRSSQGKAEAEYQQAERLVNRGEYDSALVHLNRIQIDREASDAATKTEKLRNRIMKEKLKNQVRPPDLTP